MPLPDNGTPWPPPTWGRLLDEIRVDDAWYSGDRKKLAAVYRDQPYRADGRRRLWGRKPAQPGKREQRRHIPLPGDIASTSADLLFSETPSITVDDTTTQARLEELLQEGGMGELLPAAAETAAALSGVYLRATWDREVADRPLLTEVHPDAAIPEVRYGMLRAVTFWRELDRNGSTVMRHLERHEPGVILHGLYVGDEQTLGHRVPLTEHPETAALVDSLDPDGPGDTISTGIRDLTAVYVPNIRPNRRHRGSPMGRSDFQGLHDLFDALDETWTSWLRDIRLARARLIVPADYLRNLGPGAGADFDLDREVFEALNIPPTEGGGITLSQFAIRVAEHQATAESIVRQAAQSAGYSAQSFGLDGRGGPITATEVESRDQRSMVTRGKKTRYWRRQLAHITHVLLQLDAAQFNSGITPARPLVEFGDGVAEDPTTVATTLDMLHRAQAVSIDTRVRMLHPDWDDTAVRAEVARIIAEHGLDPLPDPTGGTPLPPAADQDAA